MKSTYIYLNNGNLNLDVIMGKINKFKVSSGQKYKILVKKNEEELLLDHVIAKRSGDDLILELYENTQIVFENYYNECRAGACFITLPGKDSLGHQVLAEGVAGITLSDGTALVYAHGDRSVLMGMAQGNASLLSALAATQGAEITFIPGSLVSASATPGWLAPLGLATAFASVASASKASTNSTNAVAGSVVAGPVVVGNDLDVVLYKANGLDVLAKGKIKNDGTYFFDIGTYTGVVIAKLDNLDSNPDYRDEATGELKGLSGDLMAMGIAKQGTVYIDLNVLTTVAVRKAGIKFEDLGQTAQADVSSEAVEKTT